MTRRGAQSSWRTVLQKNRSTRTRYGVHDGGPRLLRISPHKRARVRRSTCHEVGAADSGPQRRIPDENEERSAPQAGSRNAEQISTDKIRRLALRSASRLQGEGARSRLTLPRHHGELAPLRVRLTGSTSKSSASEMCFLQGLGSCPGGVGRGSFKIVSSLMIRSASSSCCDLLA